MKTKLFIVATCALMLIAAGCKDKTPVEPELDPIAGNVETPSWTAPESYDMTASMTAVIKVDLSQTYPRQVEKEGWKTGEGDLIAAFSGETCIGVDTLGADRADLFFLFMSGLNEGDIEDVQLRYYSKQLKNIFKATELIPFRNDAELGSVSEPYTPEFK